MAICKDSASRDAQRPSVGLHGRSEGGTQALNVLEQNKGNPVGKVSFPFFLFLPPPPFQGQNSWRPRPKGGVGNPQRRGLESPTESPTLSLPLSSTQFEPEACLRGLRATKEKEPPTSAGHTTGRIATGQEATQDGRNGRRYASHMCRCCL